MKRHPRPSPPQPPRHVREHLRRAVAHGGAVARHEPREPGRPGVRAQRRGTHCAIITPWHNTVGMAPRYAPLGAAQLAAAFQALDRLLTRPVTLIVGGGTAMMLAYRLPVRTMDVDAYPREGKLDEIMPAVREVAKAHGLPHDWINPWYETFAYVLPPDYGARLRPIFRGERLTMTALGVEDLLVMKCFAGREKDIGHARALLKRDPDLGLVEGRIQELADRGVAGAQDALDFLDDLTEGSR